MDIIINKKEALDLIKEKPYISTFEIIDKKLLKDKEVIYFATCQHGNFLEFADESLKNDKEFVLKIVKNCGLALRHASPNLQDDKDVVIAAISENIFALDYASQRLIKDEDIKKIFLAKIKEKNLLKISQEKFIKYFDGGSLGDYEDINVIEYIVNKIGYGCGICTLPSKIRNGEFIALSALENNPLSLYFLNNEYKSNKEVIQKAMEKNYLVKYLASPELKMKMELLENE